MTSVWLVWHYDYEQSGIEAAYDSEHLAEAHAKHRGDGHGVEEIEVRSEPPTWRPYFHGMAQVGCVNPALDKEPFTQRGGTTDGWEPDPEERVSTCPGNWLIGDDRSRGDAVWLSVSDMDESRVLARVTTKFEELRARRDRDGSIPSWFDMTREEFAS